MNEEDGHDEALLQSKKGEINGVNYRLVYFDRIAEGKGAHLPQTPCGARRSNRQAERSSIGYLAAPGQRSGAKVSGL